ncbi:hypothetical protein ACHAW5_006409 [Stephanodiscus triporus]|uniref:Uncharacterized protein n=1 Tax=Stephanodiscus triporus TaxID=2934178 RepID=A0ABD3NZZ3_9STRA
MGGSTNACNPCYAIIIDSLTEFEEALTTFGTDYFFVLDVVGTAKFEAGRRGLAANAGGNKNCNACYAEIKNDLEELAKVLLLFEEQTKAIAAKAGILGLWYQSFLN